MSSRLHCTIAWGLPLRPERLIVTLGVVGLGLFLWIETAPAAWVCPQTTRVHQFVT